MPDAMETDEAVSAGNVENAVDPDALGNPSYPPLETTNFHLDILSNRIEDIRSEVSKLIEATEKVPAETAGFIAAQFPQSKATEPQSFADRWLGHRPYPTAEIQQLNCDKEALEGQITKLKGQVESLRTKLSKRDGELHDARAETATARSEAAKLRQKEATFRTIILDKTGEEKVSDEQVKDQFSALRQRIQGIASSGAYNVDATPVLPDTVSEEMADFYDSTTWTHLPSKERLFRVRAKMFRFLHWQILNLSYFGIENVKKDNTYVEHGLALFERILRDEGVSDDAIADWVINTIQCAELLHEDTSSTSRYVARKIFDFFSPILGRIGVNGEGDLRVTLENLCQDALALRMVMRKSKEGYRCELIEPGSSILEFEDLAEPYGVENGAKNKDKSDTIAYTLFGALTKYTQREGGKRRVLEKAHVILKQRCPPA